MSNDVAQYDEPDDGFDSSLNSGRLLKGLLLRWNDQAGWHDRDGIPPPNPLLLVAINDALQRWQDKKPTTITEKPLPDIEELNASIPVSEWEIGLDGKPRPPWQPLVIVYLVNLGTGEFLTFMSSTVGARMAYEALKEAVVTMRALRGARVMPMVNLATRPMKTKFGMKARPHFEIVGWRTPGDDARLVAPRQQQLAAPAPAALIAEKVGQPASAPAAKAAAQTVEAMGKVEPVTTEEFLNDELPW